MMHYICAECSHEQDAMNRCCDACGSIRVIAKEVAAKFSAPQLTVLSLGWGVQSWTLAAMSALGKLPKVDYAIHADTTWEREQTYTFAEQWTPWLEEHGVKVVTVRSKRAHEQIRVGAKSGQRYILIPAFLQDEQTGETGPTRRQCTGDWKIDPQDKHVNALLKELKVKKSPGVVEKWLGISQDEWRRAKHSALDHVTHRYPLLEMKMSRADCLKWLQAHDLPSPGKSACVFCPYTNTKTWQEMKRKGGSDWQVALEVDTSIRSVRASGQEHIRRGGTLFLHRSCKPLGEAVQIPEDYGMEQPDMFGPAEDDELASCDSGHCFL
jgi:hypothetical protein